MELGTDEDEHSIEMHLPYVRKIFEGYVNSVLPLGESSHKVKKNNLNPTILGKKSPSSQS